MAKKVEMQLAQPVEIGRVDVEFKVYDGRTLMGRVLISKGGIDWKPNRRPAIQATWEEFAEWMES